MQTLFQIMLNNMNYENQSAKSTEILQEDEMHSYRHYLMPFCTCLQKKKTSENTAVSLKNITAQFSELYIGQHH